MNADIVPIKRLPDQLGVFTYRVPDTYAPHVQRGAYVRIPFRGQKLWGVVVQYPSQCTVPHVRLRDIVGVRDDVVLTDTEVTIAERAAALYRTSIATVALHAFPMPMLRGRGNGIGSVVKQKKDFRFLFRGRVVFPKSPLLRAGTTIAVWNTYAQRYDALVSIARTIVSRGQTLLCCTPHRVRMPELWRIFRSIANTVVMDRTDARTTAWNAAIATRRAPTIIIGTRAAIWCTPLALGAIVVDDADSDDLAQWDADPRYDARAIARWIAAEQRIPLVLLSTAPRIVDWTHADHRLDLGVAATAPIISDLHLHWRGGGHGSLTSEAQESIDHALDAKRVAIVLHNRRGLASRVTCADCDVTLQCPACTMPLAEHEDGLRCHRCGTLRPMPIVCPSCQSPRLAHRGVGTSGMVRELAKRYPHVRIARVDRDAPQSPPTDAQIIVGSERFLHTIAPTFARAVGTVVIIDAARFVRSDDYRASERLFQTLRHTIAWADAWKSPCIIQTTIPDLPALTALQSPLTEFYRSETAERVALRYPPSTRLMHLTTTNAVGDEVDNLRHLLESVACGTLSSIDGPFPVHARNHAQPRIGFLIRLDARVTDVQCATIARALPPEWTIAVDPVAT